MVTAQDVQHTPGAFPEPDPLGTPGLQRSLWNAVHARQSEYTRSCQIRIKVGTWNVAALKETEKDLSGWFVEEKEIAERVAGFIATSANGPDTAPSGPLLASNDQKESVEVQDRRASTTDSTIPKVDRAILRGGDEVDLYVLGLQEIVDINSPAEAFRPYVDPGPSQKWKSSLIEALPHGYEVVAQQQLVGLFLLVAASADLVSKISSVSTTSVGTGLLGYMGNKGAVAARLVLGASTRIVFINCHLAAGVEKGSLERRNWDVAQIVQRTRFKPTIDEAGSLGENGDVIGDEDFAWWFGDLNYRLDGLPGDDVRRLLTLHARDEYDAGNSSEQNTDKDLSQPTAGESTTGLTSASLSNGYTSAQPTDITPNPASLSTTLSSLLPHDQLRLQQAARKAFHEGWREGPINFLPTYKYDVGSVGTFDSSEKKRSPSWCDRILFRTRADQRDYQMALKDEEDVRKRDAEMKARGLESAAKEDNDILFSYDPETDGASNENIHHGETQPNQDLRGQKPAPQNSDDNFRVNAYTSHQRVLSSDHKPLVGIFTFSFDQVVLEMKERVYREVARDFDKAENEERPSVTVVIDHSHNDPRPSDRSSSRMRASDAGGVAFGEICYLQEKFRYFTVANTGRVPASIVFLQRTVEEEAHPLPAWLTLQVDQAKVENDGSWKITERPITIQPGDATNVTLRLQVNDINLVRALNEGKDKLGHILVLRVLDGRDYFVPIWAVWMQSSFGRSLEELIGAPEGGVRGLPDRPRADQDLSKTEARGSTPSEIFQLVDAIEKLVESVVAGWGMTGSEKEAPLEKDAGWPFSRESWTFKDRRFRDIRRLYVHEALDTNKPPCSLFPSAALPLERLEIMAEVLLDFLASLKDGIVTESLWVEIEQQILLHEKAKKISTPEEERMWIFEALSNSPVHNVAFVFLTSMLARVASEAASSKGQDENSSALKLSSEVDSRKNLHSSKKTLNEKPSLARKQVVNDAYASIFADLIIRGGLPIRDRERRATQQRRRHVIRVFLNTDSTSER